MHNTLNAMKLEFYTQKGGYGFFVPLVYALGIVIGLVTKTAYLSVFIILIVSAAFMGTVFQVAERNHLGMLYGILPPKKGGLVAGRYIDTMLFGLVNLLLAALISYAIPLVLNQPFNALEYQASLAGAFLFFCFFIGVAFPVYYRFGINKSYLFANLPMYILFVLGNALIRKGNLSSLQQILNYFIANPAMIWVVGLGGGLVLLAVSYLLAVFLYRKYDL